MGKITIDTALNNSGFEKGYREAESATKKFVNSVVKNISGIGNAFSGKTQASIDRLTQKLARQTESIDKQKMKVDGLQTAYSRLAAGDVAPKGLVAMEKELIRNQKEAAKLDVQISALSDKIDVSKSFGMDTTAQQAELETLQQRLSAIDVESDKLGASIERIRLDPSTSAEAEKLSGEFGLASQQLERMTNEAAATESQIKQAMKPAPVENFGNAVKKSRKSLLDLILGTRLFSKESRKSGNAVSAFGGRLMNLVKAAFVFNIIRRGLTELRNYLGSMLQTNAAFVASVNSIKVNLMIAFQPIYEAILPALNALMSALATATAYIAAFVSMLFGKTYAESRAAAKALNAQAKALGATGSAAEKAAGQLASFDLINQQAAETAGGGSGGGGVDFEAAEIPQIDYSWLDEFKRKLLDIVPDLDYFFGLGAALAKKVADGLNSIDWNYIQAWASSFAKKLAAFLNGFLTDVAMWEAIGHTIAQGINTALIFLYDFITTFKWSAFGKAIGGGINKFIKEVDWNLTAETLSKGMLGALSFIGSAIEKIDWQAIGNSVNTFLSGIKWDEVFSKLAETLGVAAAGLGLLMWGAIKPEFDKFGEEIKLDMDKNGTSAVEAFYKAYVKRLAEPFAGLENAVNEFLASFWGKILGKELEVPAKSSGESIVDGFDEGLQKAWTFDPVVKFKDMVQKIKDFLGIHSPSTVFAEIGTNMMQGLINGISSLMQSVVSLFSKIWENIKIVWGVVKGWFETYVITPIKNAFDTGLRNILEFFSKAWENIKIVWNQVKGWFETYVINPIKNLFDAGLKVIKDFFSTAWTGIQSIWNTVKSWFESTVITPLKTAFDTALNTIKDFFSTAWTGVQAVWKAVATWFTNTVTDPVKKGFDNAIKDITGFFQGLWTTISGIFSKIGDLISGVLDKIGDVITGSSSASKAASKVKTSSSPSTLSAVSDYGSISLASFEVPALATGTVVPPNNAFLNIMSDSPEPISPTSMMKQAFVDAMEEMGGGLAGFGATTSRNVTVVLEVDRQVFGSVVVDLGQAESQRRGVRISSRVVTK